MKLNSLADGLALTVLGEGDPELLGLTEDSRQVKPGDVFAAVKGDKTDGRSFIQKALAAGAAAILAFGEDDREGFLKNLNVPILLAKKEGFRETVSRAARLVYENPDEKLFVIGVTGTNGKTTTTYLLEDVLNGQGWPCGVIGTVNYRWPGPSGLKIQEAPNTTPEGPLLWKLLKEMVFDGARAVVIEVSSHALELGRLGDLRFDLAMFTNLSRDHLDFHPDMDAYFEAKKKLFTEKLKVGAKKSVVGVDDPHGQKLYEQIAQRAVGFGLSDGAQYQAKNVRVERNGLRFNFAKKIPGGPEGGANHEGGGAGVEMPIVSPLMGKFNAVNLLGVLAAADQMGLEANKTAEILSGAKGAPGRLERVGQNDAYLVLVDYSHTPASVAAALESLRLLKPRKLLCVFGCGGDRDKGKRPQMAETAGRLADVAILTSDNPRTEDPLAIMADASLGFEKLGLSRAEILSSVGRDYCSYLAEPDRAMAINAACGLMKEGDVLLIAGKGHEDYQIVGTVKRHFDDREVAKASLDSMGKS
ncbi:MAG: UDP-N-acetylmuramoyl-L-alanyl-D-glutamate--2,6-diaminopimelate ligase [Deltaproteobacteria bacterium]|jgi:UDP-N-acetylmuramoyl-L-alanyl-D-glutamate--2,6-diaminopimelate ligase|nr:UDP-N-acetylmuramoyl-L-alanyl-D-glutamate--2,6-diaminopimelate ligase [Deltaproteobacteria bacterium]